MQETDRQQGGEEELRLDPLLCKDEMMSKSTPGCRCHGQPPVMKLKHVGSRHAGFMADKRAIDDVLAPSPGSRWGFRGGTRFMAGN